MLRAKVFDVCFGRDEKSIFNNIYVVRKQSFLKQCTLFLTFCTQQHVTKATYLLSSEN